MYENEHTLLYEKRTLLNENEKNENKNYKNVNRNGAGARYLGNTTGKIRPKSSIPRSRRRSDPGKGKISEGQIEKSLFEAFPSIKPGFKPSPNDVTAGTSIVMSPPKHPKETKRNTKNKNEKKTYTFE